MRKDEISAIKKLIDEASVISFDVFDTLLFRKVNEPEIVFDIVGKHFGIHGFRKIRIDGQIEAKRRILEEHSCPFVDIDDIYEVILENKEILVDWNEVKAFELQVEEDAMTANTEMIEMYNYARDLGKYVIAIGDIHLPADALRTILEENGYVGLDYVCSFAAAHKFKSESELFNTISQKFHVTQEDMLYIGECKRDDLEIKAYRYRKEANIEKIKNVPDSDIDKGLYKILYKKEQGFGYNIGIEVGGPLYMALYTWFLPKIKNCNKKIYFLSKSGYYLYRILKNAGFDNIEYLPVSKADITYNGEKEINEQVGKLLSEDAIVFDSDWNGGLQYTVECFKKTIGCEVKTVFYYLGICNTEESRHQLHGMHYDTFLFDFYRNYALQLCTDEEVEIYKLLGFGTYEQGDESESIGNNWEDGQILKGILDYFLGGIDFVQKYGVEYSPEKAVGRLRRLAILPTKEEAIKIGFTNNRLIKEKSKDEISEYHLEDSQSIRNYYRWIRYQKEHPEREVELTYRPKFSVVIPVYNTVTEQLKECIDSVLAQTYDNFELILIDDHSSWSNVVPVLKEYESDERIHIIYRSINGHISVATNDGIALAQGDFIAFMDCDDTIESNALYEMAKKLNENSELDFIYSDEDKITEDGKIHHLPFFKPDWSPDLYMCMNYTNHLSIYRTTIVKEIGGLRSAYNGSQDYDFTLRFLEKTSNEKVGHVSKILYHWRERKESAAFAMSAKNYAADAARYAKEDWIRRNQENAYLEYIPGMSQYRMIYRVVGNPLVSIIIPSKDNPDVLKQCIDSVYEFTTYQNFEVIVIDNGSNDFNKVKISEYLRSRNATYIYQKETFNFSKMCNTGARRARGEYLLFLNDDVEAFRSDWMERMLGHAQRPHIGAVGAKLFYPETTKIQHAGVGNIKGGPSHNFLGFDDRGTYYFGFNHIDYNCIAVTGACLMIASDKFWEINGFDETLSVNYNDVCVCFSLHEAGYYNVIRNDVILYHYESFSRGYDYLDDTKILRLSMELEKLYLRFPKLTRKDPYLNENLHLYGANLVPSIQYNNLKALNLAGVTEKGYGNIDSIETTNDIKIIGWSYIDDVEIVDRYIVFVDPFGNSYQAPVVPMLRQDVVDAFEGEIKCQYAGVECILNRFELRIDIMPYSIGILSVDKNENRYIIWWSRQSDVMRNLNPRPFMCAHSKILNFEKCDKQAKVRWHIDYIKKEDNFYEIAGFAYHIGDNHFEYQISLVLADDTDIAYEFEVQNETRIDVAAAFPEQHFLYNTGFKCYVLKDILEQGKEYAIVIRLRNQFEQDDIEDAVTREKIS